MRLFLIVSIFSICLTSIADENRIKPYTENPRYWQYEGKPLILLGGTDDDNPFQWTNLEEHLDLLKSVGGNYIRNTMSDRNDKGFELYAFQQLENGKYELSQWNEEYWQRFETMLKLTNERDIIVQIEVFDRFDYTDNRDSNRWQAHPYNPKNNVNYTYEESGFVERYPDHPGQNKHHFFYSVPTLENYDPKYDTFRKYQEAFVEKMLSYSLEYNNVLYCMNNETDEPAAWGQYWINFITHKAKETGKEIMITDMFDDWDIKGKQHHVYYENPDTYLFIDVSQNNHNKGQQHWDNIQWARGNMMGHIRPINTVKIYGADTGRYGTNRDGQERFWRNIIGGLAGTRFHRPDSGLGLSKTAQAHIKSMRMLLEKLAIVHCSPDIKSELLRNRDDNEAYLTYNPNQQYAIFFPNNGDVDINLTNTTGTFSVQKLDILKCEWHDLGSINGGNWASIKMDEDSITYAVILVTKE